MPNACINNSDVPMARSRRRGVTLAESVFAAAVLAMAVIAVFSAIGSGTAHAQEAARRIAATMAAEDLLARVLLEEGDELNLWDGYREAYGNLTDLSGRPLAESQQKVSRRVEVIAEERTFPGFESVAGHQVVVETFDAQDRLLASISEWVADGETSP